MVHLMLTSVTLTSLVHICGSLDVNQYDIDLSHLMLTSVTLTSLVHIHGPLDVN